MNRRAFLKLFIGSVAVATIPIPKFLAPKQDLFKEHGYGDWESRSFDLSGGVLTIEMIEEAALKSASNFGKPDQLFMSPKDYKSFAKYFGYKVIYKGDEIIHERI